MDSVRHLVAVVALVVYPAALGFWLVVHPLVVLSPRAGATVVYLSGASTLVAVGWWAYIAREHLLGRDLGTHWGMVVGGIVVMGLGFGVERACRRHLSLRTLVGVPEVAREREGRLLEEGIYGRVRHPRYLGGILGLLATAMLANYQGTYLLAAAFVPGIYVVTWLEERELVGRFGERYRVYQRRVPRLIPRWGSKAAR